MWVLWCWIIKVVNTCTDWLFHTSSKCLGLHCVTHCRHRVRISLNSLIMSWFYTIFQNLQGPVSTQKVPLPPRPLLLRRHSLVQKELTIIMKFSLKVSFVAYKFHSHSSIQHKFINDSVNKTCSVLPSTFCRLLC